MTWPKVPDKKLVQKLMFLTRKYQVKTKLYRWETPPEVLNKTWLGTDLGSVAPVQMKFFTIVSCQKHQFPSKFLIRNFWSGHLVFRFFFKKWPPKVPSARSKFFDRKNLVISIQVDTSQIEFDDEQKQIVVYCRLSWFTLRVWWFDLILFGAKFDLIGVDLNRND